MDKINITLKEALKGCLFDKPLGALESVSLPGFADAFETTPVPKDGYVIRYDMLRAFIYAVARRKPMLLVGESGSGKTSFFTEMAARLNWPLTIISSSEETEVADMIGHRVIDENGRMPWADGPITKTVRENTPFLWDEIDRVRAGVLSKFHALFEGHPLVLDGNEGQVVIPDDFFIPFATANTRGMGDLSGGYGSAQMGDQATYARFSVVVNVPYMGEEAEADSFKGIIQDDVVRAAMVKFANLVRGSGIPIPFGTRNLHEWAEAMTVFKDGQQLGLKLCYVNRLEVDAHIETVANHYQTVFEEDLAA